MTVHNIKCSATDYEQCSSDLLLLRNANRAARRDDAYLNWRYSVRPDHAKPIIVFAENSAGEKIGCLSVIPHDYVMNGKTCSIGVLGDISVEREWRGRGVTEAMINYLMKQEKFCNLAGGITLPNENAARPLHQTNWETVSKLERFVKIIDLKEKLLRNQKSNWLLNAGLGCINQIIRLASLETYLKKTSEFHGVVVSDFDERFDHLWDRFEKKGMIIGSRNREYLTWRYSKHPLVTYQIYTLTHQKELCGYIVFHVTDRQCSIDDILCLDKTACSNYLLPYFLNFIRNNSLAFSIDIKTNHNDLLHLPLALFGFIKRPEYLKFMVAPNDTTNHPASFTDGTKWYLTSSDKDV